MKSILTFIALIACSAAAFAQFTLVSPTDSTVLDFNTGAPEDIATITWTAAEGAVDYNFHLDTLGGSFTPPTWTSDTLTDTMLMVSFGALDSILGTLSVAEGDTITLLWTVTASIGDDSTAFADTAFVISFVRFEATSIEVPAIADIQLYPNPAQGFVNLNASFPSAQSEVTVELSDLAGRVVWQQAFVAQSQSLKDRLDLSSLPAGLYLLNLKTQNGMITEKLELR